MKEFLKYLDRSSRKLELMLKARNWRELDEICLENKLDEQERQMRTQDISDEPTCDGE